ncbi:MFS transporter [Amycolatopsis acidiphila]|uniref:MFS transporter n=1 Tax=Amycolatopsis acidiphila TaxID=715473 RepID=A0A558A8A1_9PSEU|nr:MFS transporter [Amycolatopsis acidiphila]TVT20494.1 MFS transporter [Amycolatopsis acidiphila]UIJ57018.1 MFS transporter [Amycolatopsis acidiphila]GHG53813.1 MFS transporter [Amycolatopsis acidiphila]
MSTSEQHEAPISVETPAPSRMSRYLWLVLASAFLAWMFDSIALNVFNLILTPSMSELLHTQARGEIAGTGGLVVAIKLVAWGVGGTLFGVLTDRYGRARIMLVTIVIYAVFTGLSATAQNWEQLAIYQGLAGLGIGGEWSAGAALLAESLPERLRPRLMIVMQLAFSVGYFFAAVVNLAVGANWRLVLVWCAVPSVVVVVLRLFVKEPERWVRTTRRQARRLGSLGRLFEPDLRRRTLGGLFSAMFLMIGSFAATTFTPSWIAELLGKSGASHASQYVSYFAMLLNGGAAVGYLLLIWLVQAIGRRLSYFVFALGSLITAVAMFTLVGSTTAVLIAAPIAGFFMLGGFGVFAVYLPELFPTEVRATGQGLCFNFARIITGAGTLGTGVLVGTLGSYPTAGLLVSLAFGVGLFTIWIGPETRGWKLSDS